MIIDDRMAICGSANINDRSLLGQRDSEFCIVINDREEDDGQFAGQRVRIGKFCSSWRKKLFEYVEKTHIGFRRFQRDSPFFSRRMLLGIQFENPRNININDPVSDEFYRFFRDTARKNTLIYEEVLGTIPSDKIRKFHDVGPYRAITRTKDTDPIQVR